MVRLLIIMMLTCLLVGCATSQADLLAIEQSIETEIVEGKTTRAEVLARYGTPSRSFGNSKNRSDFWVYDMPGWTTSNLSTLSVFYTNDIVRDRDFSTESKRVF